MEALRKSAAMGQILVPAATILLALHSAMLLLSAAGHLVRQRLSPVPVTTTDVGLSAGLMCLGGLLFVGYRVFDGSDDEPSTAVRFRLVVLATIVTESVLAAVFYGTIVTNPSNGVSDFTLGLVATTGVFTSAVLVISTGLISKRA